MSIDIGERLDALEQILAHGEHYRLFEQATGPNAADMSDVLDRARARLRHGSSHTIIAIAGSTGSGKSSLFNALAGTDVATVGVRRPTTAQAEALVVGEPADDILDWLGVKHRHNVTSGQGEIELPDGLVLLDLPDHDSVEEANRSEVDRLVGLVDVFVWVADPQKYGDELLHTGYLQRLAEHGDVMLFVLSKADLLTPEGLAECVVDFARLIRADGIADPRVLGVSTERGDGMAELRSALDAAVADRNAAVLRTEADLRGVAGELAAAADTTPVDDARAERMLVGQLTSAVDGDAAAGLVAAHHRHQGRRSLGWPPLRWLARWRPSPARALPTVTNSPTLVPQVSSALRDYAQARTADLPVGWQRAARERLDAGEDALTQRLGGVSSRALHATSGTPRWWSVGAAAQWLATVVMVVALAWLVLLFVVETFLQVDIAAVTPDWRGVPLPTWLLLAAVVTTLVLTVVFRALVAVGAARRGRHARSEIESDVRAIAKDSVVSAIDTHRADANSYRHLTGLLVA